MSLRRNIAMSEFNNMKDIFNSIEVPKEIDFVIEAAIKKGKNHRKHGFLRPLAIAAACIIVFIASINVSPAFANMIGGIPGLSSLVKLVSFDKGLYSATGNGFIMEINKSAVDKGITLTINNAILDRRKLVIEYTVETAEAYNGLNPGNIEIQDKYEHDLGAFVGYSQYSENFMKKRGIIEVTFPDDIRPFPNEIILNCKEFKESNHFIHKEPILGNWKISFKIDKNLVSAEPFVYQINKSITINYMKFYIDYIKVYPTVTDVKIRLDKNNKYKFVWFKNMRIEDEKGTKYNFRSISSTSGIDHLYNFESSYFTKPNELYFKADGIYCIPKEDEFVVLDIANKKFIDDGGYKVEYISLTQDTNWAGEEYDFLLTFKVKDEEILREFGNGYNNGISFEIIALDENNNEYTINSSRTSWGNDYIEKCIGIKNMKTLPHILKFKVSGAAKGIYDPISVKLK